MTSFAPQPNIANQQPPQRSIPARFLEPTHPEYHRPVTRTFLAHVPYAIPTSRPQTPISMHRLLPRVDRFRRVSLQCY